MAAPDAALLAALRSTARPARHLFFKMAHSQGTVLAWDGLGQRVFNGDTYTGIGNMASIQGVSQSRDLQTPEIVVTLNGVPLSALQSTDPNIRNRAATITAVWFSETSTTPVASKVVFSGYGDFLTTQFGDRSVTLSAHLRGRMADWRKAPQSYYTGEDQRRYYPGDTGFDLMETLQSTVVSGWGLLAEDSGADVARIAILLHSGSDTLYVWLPDIGTRRPVGNDNGGIFFRQSLTAGTARIEEIGATGLNLKEITSGHFVFPLAASTFMVTDSTSGTRVYVDSRGAVRSFRGEKIVRSIGSDPLILAREITSLGSATATTFAPSTGTGAAGTQTANLICAGAQALNSASGGGAGWKQAAFVNSSGRYLVNASGTVTIQDGGITANVACIEEDTGNAVSVSGGLLKCNGQNVVLSSTGVALTNSGKRIIPLGGAAATDFVRTWT